MADPSDVDLLRDLLTRSHRLLSAYEAALRRDAIDPALGRTLAAHERAHVAAVEQALAGRGDPVATVPAPDLAAALRNRRAFAEYAKELEGETVFLYWDTAARIRDPKLRQPLGSIMTCDAAHVVALKNSLGDFLVN
jgi:Ferritin-like domain